MTSEIQEHDKENEYRKEFMLRMYSAFWDCVSRAEDSAWKIMAAYVALFAGLYFFYQIIGAAAVATIFIVFSYTAIAFALRANAWFVRNMGLISNLEKEFLNKEDYEVLIPRFFADKPRFLNWEVWNIQVISYSSICVAFLFYVFPKIDICEHRIIVATFFALGLLLTIICGWHYYNQQRDFCQHAPGKEPVSVAKRT
jgi:hypothetical protein